MTASLGSLSLPNRRNVGDSLSFLVRGGALRWWIDILMVVGFLGLVVGLLSVERQWIGVLRPTVQIDLSVWALPKYTFFSLTRGLVAYVLSLLFTLVYGYWAAKDQHAEKILVPLLDILQSIPVLGFMPGVVLSLVALFPHSNFGLELAAVLMIFTGQAWNMTFSYYHSIRNVPGDLREVATVYRFSWWRRLRRVELPFSTMGLVWNSMMSMAGGWFFLMITEAFQLGDKDFRLPGLGSYMSVAAEQKNGWAQFYAIIAMIVMIVALDQFLWRPVTVWAQKFRVEETGSVTTMTSWFLDFLRHSRIVAALTRGTGAVLALFGPKDTVAPLPLPQATLLPSGMGSAPELTASTASLLAARPAGPSWLTVIVGRFLSTACLALLIGTMLFGGYKLWALLRVVPGADWLNCLGAGGVTLLRVLVSTIIGTLWAVPVGIMIGLSPRLSRLLQPVVQVVASFPAPMLFPALLIMLHWMGVSLNYGAVVLMLMGTQWYILFNVIAGSMAIPADLQEAAFSYNFSTLRRFTVLYIPAVFPYLVTGWVTASGGAWNASIVAEYYALNKGSDPLMAYGLGATISKAAFHENLPLLAAAIVVMSALVVAFNLSVWRRLYHLAESRYSLNK